MSSDASFLARIPPHVARLLPFLRWWPRVNRVTLRADGMAGLIGAAIVLPQGVAFATIAGMPPEYGLYAAIVPAIIAALFGSSWHLVSGPTTAISIVIYSTMSTLAEPGSPPYVGLVLMATFITGVFQLAMGVARLGVLVNFISHTVVVGFTAGAALLIASSQIQHFFGLPMERGMSFLETIKAFVTQVQGLDLLVTSVGLVTLFTGLLVRRKYPRFPYMIVAMVTGSLYALALTRLPGLTAAQQIATVSALPAALPQLAMPDFSLEALRKTTSVAIAITMLGLTEAVSIARAIAVRSEQRIDGNQEFIGQGLSNIVGSFFSAYASSGSFNRSGLNYEAGAKTPLASIFAALFLVVILLVLAPLARYLPIPAMAAILFLIAWGLIDFKAIRNIIHTSRSESAVLAITLLATLTTRLEVAIYIGVLLSLMLYLKRTSRPRIVDVKPDPAEHSYLLTTQSGLPDCLQLKLVRINGSIFFGAVDHVQGVLQRIDADNPQQKHLLIEMTGVNFIDVAGAEMLAGEAKRRRRLGGGLYLYRVNDDVMSLLTRGGYLNDIGKENIFSIKARAVGFIYPLLDSEICRSCERRIFRECKASLPNGEPREPVLVAPVAAAAG
ncbi:MAG TPA: SulP family inorganic anion transporter [Burkholderiales bacterium]|nr:SulP family inorganic anion transporter [Burkholderiales bacterium]